MWALWSLLFDDNFFWLIKRVRLRMLNWRGTLIVWISSVGIRNMLILSLLHPETRLFVYGMLEVSKFLIRTCLNKLKFRIVAICCFMPYCVCFGSAGGKCSQQAELSGENINITYKPDGTHIAVGNRVCSKIWCHLYKLLSCHSLTLAFLSLNVGWWTDHFGCSEI